MCKRFMTFYKDSSVQGKCLCPKNFWNKNRTNNNEKIERVCYEI